MRYVRVAKLLTSADHSATAKALRSFRFLLAISRSTTRRTPYATHRQLSDTKSCLDHGIECQGDADAG